MRISELIDQLYWGVFILVPLGYAYVDFQAFKRTLNTNLFIMSLIAMSIFFTTSLSFLMRKSMLIQGNLGHIRLVILAIASFRAPLDLYFLSRTLKALPDKTSAAGLPVQGTNPSNDLTL